MKTGAQLIADERERQISQEGFDDSNDDGNNEGELLMGANAYLQSVLAPNKHPSMKRKFILDMYWPRQWNPAWFKPTNDMRDLAKAGALIAAEMDRRMRAHDAEMQAKQDEWEAGRQGVNP